MDEEEYKRKRKELDKAWEHWVVGAITSISLPFLLFFLLAILEHYGVIKLGG